VGIRFRRRCQWSTVPWTQISAVESVSRPGNSRRESVVLTLASGALRSIGAFDGIFARTLRDRLRYEIASHAAAPESAISFTTSIHSLVQSLIRQRIPAHR